MSAQELSDLALDIKANGQHEPIMLRGGEIVDGRNRLAACKLAGVEPDYAEMPANLDVIAYIIGANVHRRHLTTQQRAACAAELANLKRGGDRTSKGPKDPLPPEPPITLDDAAKKLNVGRRTVVRAKKRMIDNPEEHERVKRGEKPPKAAPKKKPAITISERTKQMDEPAVAHELIDTCDKALDRGGLFSPKVQGQLIQLTKRAAYLSKKDRGALIAALRRVAAMAEKHAAAHEKILATTKQKETGK
jgi:hypothetical protein